MYEGSEETTKVERANDLEQTDEATIHLSATDGEMVSDATQIIFHKLEEGTLFVELFPNVRIEKTITYFPFTLSDDARRKLREFLNTPVTY